MSEKNNKDEKFYSAKNDRVFYTIMIDLKDHSLMEALLSTILGKPVTILEYPRTELKVKTAIDKTKTIDCIVKMAGEIIHLEIETGTGLETKVKNLTYFASIYSENTLRGEKYDTKTKFIHIDLQFNEGRKKYLIDEYYIKNEKQEVYIENFKMIVVNIDRIKAFWYSKDKEMIKKYKYLMMLDLEPNELKKLEKEEKLIEKFSKSIIELNKNERFRAMMSKEEEMRILANTREEMAYEEGGMKAKIETAKNLLNIDLGTVEQIAKATGLSVDEVTKLKQELGIKNS